MSICQHTVRTPARCALLHRDRAEAVHWHLCTIYHNQKSWVYDCIFLGFSRTSLLLPFIPALSIWRLKNIWHLTLVSRPHAHAPNQLMNLQSRPPAGRQLEMASAITEWVVITIVLILCFVFGYARQWQQCPSHALWTTHTKSSCKSRAMASWK